MSGLVQTDAGECQANEDDQPHADVASDCGSVAEESLRQLFQACDIDGDGFIDSHDLLTICQDLRLDFPVEDLIQELGADDKGRISFSEFVRTRRSVKQEIRAIRIHGGSEEDMELPGAPVSEYLHASSDNSLGGSGKHEAWEFDSGARDLSPEPGHLQKLMEVAGASHKNPSNMLELANKFYLAALTSMKAEIRDLSSRLSNVLRERNVLEEALNQAQVERIQQEEETNAQLSSQAQQYEERLTELHSVIAELTKRMEVQRDTVIQEEDEEEETEPGTPPRVSSPEESPTTKAASKSQEAECSGIDDKSWLHPSLEKQFSPQSKPDSIQGEPTSIHIESLQAEVAALQAENIQLTRQMQEQEQQLCRQLEEQHEHSSSKLSSTKVAEQLVRHLLEESSTQEVIQEVSSGGPQPSEAIMKQFEVEFERLNAKVEHLKSQNDVLTLTLEESKNHADNLTIIMGKCEANNGVLQMALKYCNQALDAMDALSALLESKVMLLLAELRSGNGEEEPDSLLQRVAETCSAAEEHAKLLLGCASQPAAPQGESEEVRLRAYVTRIKTDTSKLMGTIVDVGTVHHDVSPTPPHSLAEASKLDLEIAVLIQELMAGKEEKAELKAQVYLLEKEKTSLELRLNSREAQEEAYRLHIDFLKSQVDEVMTPQEFNYEWSEQQLKARVKELVTALEKVTRNAELRQRQTNEFVSDLKRANSTLLKALDRSKRKSQLKIKKLEQQLISMAERNASQVRQLKQQLQQLEKNAQTNETEL